ncbi:hypothetical protein K432DRAFT_277743, partial [Lepidopterella palustris CBS 459.81]
LPPSTIIGINRYASHTNVSVFGPNAGEPKPERWLDPSPESISQKLLIFGGPSRSYPGQNLAMFVVAKTLVRLFGECEV